MPHSQKENVISGGVGHFNSSAGGYALNSDDFHYVAESVEQSTRRLNLILSRAVICRGTKISNAGMIRYRVKMYISCTYCQLLKF